MQFLNRLKIVISAKNEQKDLIKVNSKQIASFYQLLKVNL